MRPHPLLGWLCLLLAACSSSGFVIVRPKVEVEIINQSSRDMKNAHATFGEYVCIWGSVIKSTSKGYMYYPHLITAESELHWDEDGKHRMEKLDLRKVYQRGKSGRLSFTVYDGRVEVSFVERK